jgi:hypothetical protein
LETKTQTTLALSTPIAAEANRCAIFGFAVNFSAIHVLQNDHRAIKLN